MIEITKPTVARLVTLDDTDDYTAALTVYEHREKLTAVLTPEQLHQFAHEAQELAEHLVRERDAAKADEERPRTEHAFDIDTAAATIAAGVAGTARRADQYVWITRPNRAGVGLWDRGRDVIAWWNRQLSENGRTEVKNLIDGDKADWLVWVPAESYRPFEIAVFS